MLVGGGFDRLATAGQGQDRAKPSPAIAVSLAFHMALLVIAFVVRIAAPPPAPVELHVRVSIVAAPDRPPTAAPKPGILAAPPATAERAPPASGMIEPSTMLSGRTLADPRSKQARADLATFADSERVLQLCNLEAMDQIHAWRGDFRPEKLVAYARSNETVVGDTIRAEGAAFFSRKAWYDLKFTCRISADHHQVVAFAFAVGNSVPRADWDDLGLPAGGDED